MSLLAPLYFFGALAIGLPILFHLIRRQPKGQVEFSSLMFLRPTPPRLTRRSRLDNWLLLLLRGLALLLLAAAFARPFLRNAVLSDAELPGRRIVLVVDTSASMQRSGLWQQALDKSADVLADLQPADSLALVMFDSQPRLAIGFEESSQMNLEQLRSAVKKALRDAEPSWRHTELGRAISFAGDVATSYEVDRPQPVMQSDQDSSTTVPTDASGPAHMILVTDMQAGSRVESLQVYAWPKELRLDVRKVAPPRRTNAWAQILAATLEESEDPDRVRVRVSNAADSESGKFTLAWSSSDTVRSSNSDDAASSRIEMPVELPVHVPPGQTRVVRMPSAPPGVSELVLKGDEHSFDNTRYVVSPEPAQLNLHFIGQETNDPRESLLYYLQRVPLNSSRRTVAVDSLDEPADVEELDPKQVPLVVLSRPLSGDAPARLRQYVEAGGRLLIALPQRDSAQGIVATINEITMSELQVSEAVVDDYAMLSRIDFSHPLFEPMADPQFNDFSKIRFWAHRKLEHLGEGWNQLARFDDGDPALLEMTIGKGRCLVLATGWQPQSGQLALSTKFIPLVYSLFELGRRTAQSDQYVVGEAMEYLPSETATITGPAGIESDYHTVADLDAVDQPGVYTFRDGEESRAFAVNLHESESRTDAIGDDQLERFGVILGKNVTTEQALDAQRQLRDRELESQQKLWQWLLVAALGILGLETLLGGLWSRRTSGEVIPASAGQ